MTPDDMAARPIEWHVRQAAELAMRTRRALNKDLQPMMHLVLPDGTLQLVQFEGPPPSDVVGDFIAMGARLAVLEHQPRHAVLIIEGWTVKRALMPSKEHPEVTDPDVRAVIAGRLRPSKLPPHKRGTNLTIYGESADGAEAWIVSDIEGHGAHAQAIEAMSSERFADAPEATKGFILRFRPLFLAEALLRGLDPAERFTLECMSGGREALLDAARNVAKEFLAEGGTGTPNSFSTDMADGFARMRAAIGWKGGRR